MKKLAFLLMVLIMVFTSCDTKKHRPKLAQVSVYHVPNTGTSDPNDWLFYYLIFNNHTNTYYYYVSPTEIANFSTTKFSNTVWATSTTLPPDLTNQTPIGQIDEPLTELPNEIEVEMDAVIEAPADVESGDGGSNSSQSSAEEDGDGDASDGNSSSDSGGDSGGGDGGGGDGGGGD
jgi:uncharacterized membrane protein YgcG